MKAQVASQMGRQVEIVMWTEMVETLGIWPLLLDWPPPVEGLFPLAPPVTGQAPSCGGPLPLLLWGGP